MPDQQKFSNDTKSYLCRFYEILDEMIAEMGADLTDSLSHNFIVRMIPHHRAAIEMSLNLLGYTTFVPLQNIALNIIKEQTKSIENMQDILSQCSELENSGQDLCLYQKRFRQITDTMFSQMRNTWETNDINADFMREMIPHHEGAISMSQNILRYDVCPELIPIFEAIINSQRVGVREMERLLRRV